MKFNNMFSNFIKKDIDSNYYYILIPNELLYDAKKQH